MSDTIIPRSEGHWLGRVWLPASAEIPGGPTVVVASNGYVYDAMSIAPTVSQALDVSNLVEHIASVQASTPLFKLEELVANSTAENDGDDSIPRLLSPVDLQCVKACGVTFAGSLLERVIEERAAGDATKVDELRHEIQSTIGEQIANIVPGSERAKKLEHELRKQGLWSQYLEVGIGKDAEVFTKSPVLSSVGYGQHIGLHPESQWNNPEPEVVLIVNSSCQCVGATLGNDVNLRDFEGRSALLLGKAKDNNASCALGPFIRVFDETFTLEDLKQARVSLTVRGLDGYELNGGSDVSQISRPFEELIKHTSGATHQYPDGFALMTGTLFVPCDDRDEVGAGFTHRLGDEVTVASSLLGRLQNTVTTSDLAPPWKFGISALVKNLYDRGYLGEQI